jgi:hypothetical protein
MGLNYGPRIVRDGLILSLDAADPNSYPGSGNTWYDLSGKGYHHTIYNSPSYTNDKRIVLPDYWYALVHKDTITIHLTPIGADQSLWVDEITPYNIIIGSDTLTTDFFYSVFAERKDIDDLITEHQKR